MTLIEFLTLLGKTTGKTLTKEEFAAIIREALEEDKKGIPDKKQKN